MALEKVKYKKEKNPMSDTFSMEAKLNDEMLHIIYSNNSIYIGLQHAPHHGELFRV
jgi:hypothetical protein